MGTVLWCERTLSFQSSPRCGLCVVVCEDFEFLNYNVCGPCAVVLPGFVPVLERLIFQKKSPYRDFPSVLERLFLGVKNLYRDFSMCWFV